MLMLRLKVSIGKEDENSCRLDIERRTTMSPCSQEKEISGSRHSEDEIRESEDKEKARGCESVEMTDAEKEAADILMGMRSAKVELLDVQTCNCYFEAIRRALGENMVDHGRSEAGLEMLEKLQWQLTWLSGYEGGSRAPNPPKPCD